MFADGQVEQPFGRRLETFFIAPFRLIRAAVPCEGSRNGWCAVGVPLTNGFLEKLPAEVRRALTLVLEPVSLPVGVVLFEAHDRARYVHFVTSGMASIVTAMGDGAIVEVGICGREGFPEAVQLLGPQTGSRRCLAQIGGTALRMSFKRFEQEFLPIDAVRKLVMQQVQCETLALAQMVACNRLHEVEERLARWLLMVQDRLGESKVELTQEFLGQMLGTRRSSVSLAAGALQRVGLIEYRRGDIRINDHHGLEDVACECYRVIEKIYNGWIDPMRKASGDLAETGGFALGA